MTGGIPRSSAALLAQIAEMAPERRAKLRKLLLREAAKLRPKSPDRRLFEAQAEMCRLLNDGQDPWPALAAMDFELVSEVMLADAAGFLEES